MTIEGATEIYELLLKTTGALAATLGAWAVYRGLRAAALNLELSEIPTGVGDREPRKYRHVRVSNPRGWKPAVGVSVLLVSIEDGAGKVIWRDRARLGWRYEREDAKGGAARIVGAEQECDLLELSNEEGRPKLKIMAVHEPLNLPLLEPAKHYVLTLRAAGSGSESSDLRVWVHWNGLFPSGGGFAECLQLDLFPRRVENAQALKTSGR